MIWHIGKGRLSAVSGRSAPDLKPDEVPAGHWLAAALTIGALSMILCAGLSLLGLAARMDVWLIESIARVIPGPFPHTLGMVAHWLATITIAFGLPLLLLVIPAHWRRLVIAVSIVMSIAAWIPVLALAAHSPSLSMPLVAGIWSGICAITYATRHRMPCDVHPSASA